jgi:hypothetical protein
MVEKVATPPRRLLGFPDPVDEVSARLVAAGVVLQAVLIVATHWWPLYLLLAFGFLARVLTGPRLSPLGLLVTRVVRPRLAVAPRYVPGPPKRFAQGMGLVFSSLIAALALGFGLTTGADALLLLLGTFATLEAAFAFCLGCRIHALLARVGVVRECTDCEDVGRTLASRGR